MLEDWNNNEYYVLKNLKHILNKILFLSKQIPNFQNSKIIHCKSFWVHLFPLETQNIYCVYVCESMCVCVCVACYVCVQLTEM